MTTAQVSDRKISAALKGNPWISRILIAVVVVYVGGLILVPIVALTGAFRSACKPSLESLLQPQVLLAFWTTLRISLIVVFVHAVFGTMVAWMMVRDDFRGKSLINGFLDMPFAVSSGGRLHATAALRAMACSPQSWRRWVSRSLFALPGMILATLFANPALHDPGINPSPGKPRRPPGTGRSQWAPAAGKFSAGLHSRLSGGDFLRDHPDFRSGAGRIWRHPGDRGRGAGRTTATLFIYRAG
jgi:hypothetical protein